MSHIDKESTSSVTLCATAVGTLSSSSPNVPFTTSTIKNLLMNDHIQYQVINNCNKRSTARCWTTFGFPGIASDIDSKKFDIIPGFVSCKTCFDTYKYIDSSTANLYAHRCYKNESPDQTSITSFLRSPRSMFSSSKNISKKKEELKQICTKWIAGSMRPFRIVTDPGFKELVQICLDIGKEIRGEKDIMSSDILPSDRTIKNELEKMACIKRKEVKHVLVEAVDTHALSISPDIWTDNHRRVSYMGATAHFVDANLHYQSIDLFCVEFRQEKKTAENIYQLMEEQLAQFDLDQHMNQITFVTDRGSNFLKAFKSHKSLFCVAHRLNNILKQCFYQHILNKKSKSSNNFVRSLTTISSIDETPKMKKKMSTTYLQQASPEIDDDSQNEKENNIESDDDDDESEEEEEYVDDYDYTEVTINQLPINVRHVLNTIKDCKSLVKYVKRTGLNRQLQLVLSQTDDEDTNEITATRKNSFAGRTLHQSSVVRWLSLSDLLESIKNAYPGLVIMLNNNKQSSRIQKISIDTVEKLIEFLYPWKIIINELQKTKTPSLYLVLPCITYLRGELVNGDRREKSGIKFFYKRALQLLGSMFNMEEDYIIGAFLHPNYKQLRGASNSQISDCYEACRHFIQHDSPTDHIIEETYEPPTKKTKIFMSTLMDKKTKNQTKSDEVGRYINLTFNDDGHYQDPLDFWRKSENQSAFPSLVRLARKYYSIPCSSAAVERQFSATGQIITQRRSNLDPSTVNDIIFIRSMEKQNF